MNELTIKKEEAAKAFAEWQRQFEADPAAFSAASDKGYGESAADFFFQLIEKLRTP